MEKRFIFIDVENVKNEIEQILDTVERGNRCRLIERWVLFKYIPMIEENKYGYIYSDGGHVGNSYKYLAKTTYLTVSWYTEKQKKYVRIVAERDKAKIRRNDWTKTECNVNDRDLAYRNTFPEKYVVWRDRNFKKRLRNFTNCSIPEGFYITQVVKESNLAVVKMVDSEDWQKRTERVFLFTPDGCFELSKYLFYKKTDVWKILRTMGVKLPIRLKDRKWDDDMRMQFLKLMV